MSIELLIQCLVRQMTILIAQLATTGGARAPLAQVANQVFLELVSELERQGVGKKVSADMFGMGLRTYQRTIQRLIESTTDRGQSLWEALLDFICKQKIATRASIESRFAKDDAAQVKGLLRDLCESGLVFSSGQGQGTLYRAASSDELQAFRQVLSRDGLEELIWAIVYHQGPLSRQQLGGIAHVHDAELEATLERLVASKRIEVLRLDREPEILYKAGALFVPMGSSAGWEAAVFDHFQAMVKTICCRLRTDRATATVEDTVGGSTFTIDVWPGHPLDEEASSTLSKVRTMLIDLRKRADDYNAAHRVPERYNQVILYMGQCVIPQGDDGDD